MPDWLSSPFASDVDLSSTLILSRLALAFALGWVIAGLFRFTHAEPGERSRGLMATLVLLTVLICMLTLVIGNNVARAFSLVGALAIVRFRTVVEDTRDTAFVIFAVSVGMAVGAGFLKIPLLTIPIAGAAAFMLRPRRASRPGGTPATGPAEFVLTVRTGPGTPTAAALKALIDRHAPWSSLEGAGTARQGASLEWVYGVRLRREEDAPELVGALHRCEGVQGVDMHRR